MAPNDALDLSAIDPPIWRIMVGDVVYGPYTFGQMQSFVEEGRLSPASRVACDEDGAFSPALEHSALRVLFAANETPEPADRIEAANYLITARTDGDGRRALIAVLNEIGRFSELMSGTFILNAEISLLDLQGQLATILAERGKVVIVNAGTGQLAWSGLGPDADQHARAIWKRQT